MLELVLFIMLSLIFAYYLVSLFYYEKAMQKISHIFLERFKSQLYCFLAVFITFVVYRIIIDVSVAYAIISSLLFLFLNIFPGYLLVAILEGKRSLDRQDRLRLSFLFSLVIIIATSSLSLALDSTLYLWIPLVIGVAGFIHALRRMFASLKNLRRKINSSWIIYSGEIELIFLLISALLTSYPERSLRLNDDAIRHFSNLLFLIFEIQYSLHGVSFQGQYNYYPFFYLSLLPIAFLHGILGMLDNEIFITGGLIFYDILFVYSSLVLFDSICRFSNRDAGRKINSNKTHFDAIFFTSVWIFFGGFGWILICIKILYGVIDSICHKLNMISTIENALRLSPYETFHDTIRSNAFTIWFFFRPLNLATILLLFALSNILTYAKNPHRYTSDRLTRSLFILEISILGWSMLWMHPPEFLIFIICILCIVMTFREIKRSFIKIIIEALLYVITYSILGALLIMHTSVISKTSWLILYVLISVGVLIIVLLFYSITLALEKAIRYISKQVRLGRIANIVENLKKILVKLIAYYLIVSLVYYLLTLDNPLMLNSNWEMILSVPMHIYAFKLGLLTFIFALLLIKYPDSLIHLIRKNKLAFYAGMYTLSIIILGRMITGINITIGRISYWEYRLFPFIFLGVVIITGYYFVDFISHKFSKLSIKNGRRHTYASRIVAIIFIIGSGSTFISIIYHHWGTQVWTLSKSEKEMIDNIRAYIVEIKEVPSVVLTPSLMSWYVAEHIPQTEYGGLVKDFVIYRLDLFATPETVLSYLGTRPNLVLIQYDARWDEARVHNLRRNCNYIFGHIFRLSLPIYINDNDKIYLCKFPYQTIISYISNTALVIDDDYYSNISKYETLMLTYDLLLSSHINFTSVKFFDFLEMIDKEVLIFPDEELVHKFLASINPIALKFRNLDSIIIVNLEGYSKFNNTLYYLHNYTINTTYIKVGDNIIDLNMTVNVPYLKVKNESAKIFGYYGEKVPLFFSVVQNFNGMKLKFYYINLFPLRTIIESMSLGRQNIFKVFTTIIGLLLNMGTLVAATPTVVLDYFEKGIGSPYDLSSKGYIQISSESFYLVATENTTFSITTSESLNTRSINLSELVLIGILEGYDSFKISTRSLEFKYGLGLYSVFDAMHINVSFPEKISIYVVNTRNQIYIINNVTEISASHALVCIRNPAIVYINGTTSFRKFRYKYVNIATNSIGSIRLSPRIPQDCDLYIEGELEFKIEYSDLHYLLLREFDVHGTIESTPSFYGYDEFKPFLITLLISLLLIALEPILSVLNIRIFRKSCL